MLPSMKINWSLPGTMLNTQLLSDDGPTWLPRVIILSHPWALRGLNVSVHISKWTRRDRSRAKGSGTITSAPITCAVRNRSGTISLRHKIVPAQNHFGRHGRRGSAEAGVR